MNTGSDSCSRGGVSCLIQLPRTQLLHPRAPDHRRIIYIQKSDVFSIFHKTWPIWDEKRTVLVLIISRSSPCSNLFPRPTCLGVICVLKPSAFVHLSIHEKSGHFVRLQAARLTSELILAGDCLGREKDFGGLLLLASSANSKQLLTTVRPFVLLFFYTFSLKASSQQSENNL